MDVQCPLTALLILQTRHLKGRGTFALNPLHPSHGHKDPRPEHHLGMMWAQWRKEKRRGLAIGTVGQREWLR